jgi:hypothetical protein
MRVEPGHEVYVVIEGVFALDRAVDPETSDWVTVRLPSGARVELPIDAVADWDVDALVGQPMAQRGRPKGWSDSEVNGVVPAG